MSGGFGFRRIIAGAFVGAIATTGLAIGTGSMAAGQARPAPNYTLPVPDRGPAPEPLAPAIIVEPPAAEQTCATLRVTKVVNGTAPEGTTFHVAVNCEAVDLLLRAAAAELPPGTLAPFSTVLEFPAKGGSQDLLVGPSSCTFNETPTARVRARRHQPADRADPAAERVPSPRDQRL